MNDFSSIEMGILRNTALLQDIDERHFKVFISISSKVSFATGEILLKEGEMSDAFFIIISGAVTLYKQEEPITSLGSGETIGEMRVIQNRSCSLTVKASEPLVVLQTSVNQLRAVENHHCYEAIIESIIRIINNRLFQTNETLLNKINEKKRRTKQFIFSLCGILFLFLFIFELGLALYYAMNPTDLCNSLNLNPAQYPH